MIFNQHITVNCLQSIYLQLQATNTEINEDLIVSLYEKTAEQILIYIDEEEVPTKLRWLVQEATIRRINLLGQESTVQDTVGSTSTTYRLNPLEQYYIHLDQYIANRDSKRRVRFY